MTCKTIGDVLRSLMATRGAASPFPDQSGNEPQPIEIVSDPTVSHGPWLNIAKIAAANARDVLERRDDDRSRAERRELYARTLGAARLARGPRFAFTFGARIKAKAKPKVKVERTEEVRAYFREYQRQRRAREKESVSSSP
jgi:hypothetical protein